MKSSQLAAALLPHFLEVYPFQPATALWRATEIAVLVGQGLPPGRGLDLGCGDGHLTGIVLEHCGAREMVGIDPDAAEIELARASQIYAQLLQCGGDAVPLPDASFDFVLSNSVLEHIPDVRPVLAESARLLRAGGELIFTVPAPDFHRLLRGPIVGRRDRAAYLAELDRRLAHFYYWDAARWRAELCAVGLQMTVAKPYLNRAQTWRWEAVSRVTAGVLMLLTRKNSGPSKCSAPWECAAADCECPKFWRARLGAALSHQVNLNALDARVGSCLLVRAVKA